MTIIKCLRSLLLLIFVFLSTLPLLASEPWLLGEKEANGLCKLTSPDGNWQFWAKVPVSTNQYSFGVGDWIRGSGTLILPVQAKDARGLIYGLGEPFNKAYFPNKQTDGTYRYDYFVPQITKLVIPKDYKVGTPRLASPALLEYEVEEGHPQLVSLDGVLYKIFDSIVSLNYRHYFLLIHSFPGGRTGSFSLPDSICMFDGIEKPDGTLFYCELVGYDPESPGIFDCTSLEELHLDEVVIDGSFSGHELVPFGVPVAYIPHLENKPLKVSAEVNSSFGNGYVYYTVHSSLFGVRVGFNESGSRFKTKLPSLLGMRDTRGAEGYPPIELVIEVASLNQDDTVSKSICRQRLEFRIDASTQESFCMLHGLFGNITANSLYAPNYLTDERAVIDVYWPTTNAFVQTGICDECFGWNNGQIHIAKEAGEWPERVGALKVIKDGGVPPPDDDSEKPNEMVDLVCTNGVVLGGGHYTTGDVVTLRAVPDEGFVFIGWDLNGVEFPLGVDERSPSLTFTVGQRAISAEARFIPQSEDYAEIEVLDGALLEEYTLGKTITPITLAVDSASLPLLRVSGLPTGLYFTSVPLTIGTTHYPANTIYGTPSQSGVYTIVATATTLSGLQVERSWSVTVRSPDERSVRVACDPALGSVSVSGGYVEGETFLITAIPQEGFVFSGWELDGVTIPLDGVDLRSSSIQLTMGKRDVTVRANFVPCEDDNQLKLFINGEVVLTDGSSCFLADRPITVVVSSKSMPNCSLFDLPPGLAYNTKTGTITGTARKPGLYTVKARLTNATVKKAIEKRFQLEVPHFTAANDYFVGGLANAPGEKYTGFVGISLTDGPDLRCESGKTARVSGLPSGLKYDASKGILTGTPTRAGAYTVTVRVGQDTSTFTIEILPLPEWLVGTFNGYGVMPETLTTSSDVEAHLDHRVGESSPRVMTVTIASSGRVKIEESYSTFSRAKITTRRLNLNGLSQVEVDTDGQLTFRLVTEEATYHFKQEALEAGRAVEVEGADGCHYRLHANQWSKGEPLAPLAALIKGKKLTAEVNSDQLKCVAVTFSSNASATVKCTTPDGRTQTARGVVVCEDAEAEIYTLNVVMPNKLFVRGVLKFDELGHVAESSWWGYQPQAEE